MNRFNFNQSVGLPVDTDMLMNMQTAYSVFNALGNLAGNFSILAGCTVTGETATDGFVFINGEVLEFKGGLVQTTVKIVEVATQLEFEDLSMHDVEFVRYATFGTATTTYPWANFKAVDPVLTLMARLQTIETKLATVAEGADKTILYKGSKSTTINTGAAIEFADITFPTLGTNNYMVLGGVKCVPGVDVDPVVTWTMQNYTETGFSVSFHVGNAEDPLPILFEYIIIAK